MSNALTINRPALWVDVPVEGGVQHVRMPVRVVTVTPQQAFLGLGA